MDEEDHDDEKTLLFRIFMNHQYNRTRGAAPIRRGEGAVSCSLQEHVIVYSILSTALIEQRHKKKKKQRRG